MSLHITLTLSFSLSLSLYIYIYIHQALYLYVLPQSVEAVEYADCLSVDRWRATRRNECPGDKIKSSYYNATDLEHWGMLSNPSLPWLPIPLWPAVIVPIKVPYKDQTVQSFT